MLKLERLFAKAAKASNSHAQTQKSPTTESGVQWSLPSKTQPGKLDPRTVTREDVKEMLECVENGKLYGNNYFPVRICTPPILIHCAQVVRNEIIDDNPIMMSADKAYNAMNREGDTGTGRENRLSPDEIVAMIEKMNDPQYIVYQSANERYVEVVQFGTHRGDKAFAIIELGNHKDAVYMSGYESGLYNLLVTTYPPKAGVLNKLLNNKANQIVYDKKKGVPQRTSSSTVPSVLNDTPFFIDSIPDSSEKSNTQFSLPTQPQAENPPTANADESARAAAKASNSPAQIQGTTQYALKGHKGKGVAKRKNSWYSQFEAEAMKWSRKAERKIGDMRVLSRNGRTSALIEATENGYIILYEASHKEVQKQYELYHQRNSLDGSLETSSFDDGGMRGDSGIGWDGGVQSGTHRSAGESFSGQDEFTANNEHLRSGDQEPSVNGTRYSFHDTVYSNDAITSSAEALIEAFTAGVEGRQYIFFDKADAALTSPTMDELIEAFTAGVEGRQYVPKNVKPQTQVSKNNTAENAEYATVVGELWNNSKHNSRMLSSMWFQINRLRGMYGDGERSGF